MAAKDAPTRKRRTIKGVEEFDEAKLGPLLKRKYHKAIADLGTPDSVRQAFVGSASGAICIRGERPLASLARTHIT